MINNTINQAIVKHLSLSDQVRWAVAQDWDTQTALSTFGQGTIPALKSLVDRGLTVHNGEVAEKAAIEAAIAKPRQVIELGDHGKARALGFNEKSAVSAATGANNGALVYPGQAAGVVLPNQTPPLLAALQALGANELPANTRLLSQAALLAAVEVPEGAPAPGAAPSLEFHLTQYRKFSVLVAYSAEMLAASNFDTRVQAYVERQLTAAADNGVDNFIVGLLAAGTAAASVAAAISAFAGNLRTAAWVAAPETLVSLRSAQEQGVGPNGGSYYGMPCLPTNAAAAGKLYLVDVHQVATFDGPTTVERSEQASLVLDSAPGTAPATTAQPTSMFQKNQVAFKVVRYADASLLVPAQVISL
jgi:hypothetical protein